MLGVSHFTEKYLKATEDELAVRAPFARIETKLNSSFFSTGTPSCLPRKGHHSHTWSNPSFKVTFPMRTLHQHSQTRPLADQARPSVPSSFFFAGQTRSTTISSSQP